MLLIHYFPDLTLVSNRENNVLRAFARSGSDSTVLMFFELLMPAIDFILDQAEPKLLAAILFSRIVL